MTRLMVVAFEGLQPLLLDDNKVLKEKLLHQDIPKQMQQVGKVTLLHSCTDSAMRNNSQFQPIAPNRLKSFFSILFVYFDTMSSLGCQLGLI